MKRNNSILLSTPYLIWMVLFTLIPLGVVGYYALTDPSTGEFSLVNLRQLGMYMPVLWTSIVYSLVSAVVCLILGYPVAYYIAHCSQTAQRFLYMLVMLPMCMSFLLRTLAWVGLLNDQGIINNLLVAFFDWLRSLGGVFAGIPEDFGRLTLIRTPGAVVLGMVYNYLPYMILPLYTTISKIDRRLIEAAEDLGCNGVQTFRRVILPLSMPGILSGMTMVFVPAVSTFYISQKMGSSSTVLIGDVIERQFKQGNNPNLGAALSIVLMLLVFVCTGIMNRFGGDEEGSVVV
ncbi:MAG: ABC transporter permease [Candidatus Faecousia sp.]|nr:ABC transporter permease [Bacillota bacterium]MDY4221976.1 ABC transporter permease [Candidatus Faecousia sp.]MDY4754157.1 ABC transporter permease [Candidatus Faecousia sp.]MDY6159579.1 ABC transporter permease [Candidatus Faecousia sp.]